MDLDPNSIGLPLGAVDDCDGTRTTRASDLPLELAMLVLALFDDDRDFEACVDSELFALDQQTIRLWHKAHTRKKRRLVAEGDLEALVYIEARRPVRLFMQDVALAAATGRLDVVEWVWARC